MRMVKETMRVLQQEEIALEDHSPAVEVKTEVEVEIEAEVEIEVEWDSSQFVPVIFSL